ncbi:PTS transporter subunit IIC [Streptococcus anginosus]|uniref:PTS sugar transporter subunit IIC n=1 Tax=Streptococcus anginosus TaxID=1328 RepID=UPI000D04486D|nr:PTS sugar transporter subunit IIC [Streptococcus anginosus]MCY7232706.1 PTS sugar transporter subunit IIC [Streptococcus anginosus]PRT62904.1 PTS transporter subunit IIC [Streptococcus anginosus]
MTKENTTASLTPKSFLHKVLNGTAIGVIVALLPNCIFAIIFSLDFFKNNAFFATWNVANVLFQATLSAVIGTLVALEFNFKGMKAALLTAIAFVSSGASSKLAGATELLGYLQKQKAPAEITATANKMVTGFYTTGTGDIINVMLICALSVLVLLWLEGKFESFNFVLLPIVGSLLATVGLFTLPYVKMISSLIGQGIIYFTDLQPYLMSVLICVTFAILIVAPISTVAIGLAIGLNGLAAGASAMGVGTTCIVLVVHSFFVNKPGVTVAVALGSMKMMMTNVFEHPISYVPIVATSAVTGLLVPLFTITGTPASAGFGLVGLTGLFASVTGGLPMGLAILAWLVIPTVVAILFRLLFEKVLNLYTADIFKFEP